MRSFSFEAKPLCAASLALVLFLIPTVSHAQADQKIVMRCTTDVYNNQTLDYVIDLTARTASMTRTFFDPARTFTLTGEVTRATDDKLVMSFPIEGDQTGTGTDVFTLDRYNGQLVDQWTLSGHSETFLFSCQRKQKEF